MDITDLIYDAFAKFGEITNQQIDKLRLRHRLSVVQVNIFPCPLPVHLFHKSNYVCNLIPKDIVVMY